MKVLWIGHNLAYPPVRGVLMRNYNLLREASKHAEVHAVAFDQPRSRSPEVTIEDCLSALRKFCTYAEAVSLPQGIAMSKLWLGMKGVISGQPYDVNWFASTSMAARVKQILDGHNFDVVHLDTLGLAPYVGVAGRVNAVLNHHNIESSMMQQRADSEPGLFKRRYWQGEAQRLLNAERRYCGKFALNLVVSPEDGQALAEAVPGTVTRVVANGVDTEYFTPRPDPGGNTILFCGGLDWYPNGEAMEYFFKEIWPLLVQRKPDVRVLVVGRNPSKWLKQLGERDNRISVTGFVEDARPYFREAAVYFCPIRLGGGTRLKILDALAMGMPLVGTTFACSGIAIEHGKHALLADTPQSFVDALINVISNPELRNRMAEQGRELVRQEYSWPVVGTRLLDAYREAASAKTKNSSAR